MRELVFVTLGSLVTIASTPHPVLTTVISRGIVNKDSAIATQGTRGRIVGSSPVPTNVQVMVGAVLVLVSVMMVGLVRTVVQ